LCAAKDDDRADEVDGAERAQPAVARQRRGHERGREVDRTCRELERWLGAEVDRVVELPASTGLARTTHKSHRPAAHPTAAHGHIARRRAGTSSARIRATGTSIGSSGAAITR
jgi:hypothetical protein